MESTNEVSTEQAEEVISEIATSPVRQGRQVGVWLTDAEYAALAAVSPDRRGRPSLMGGLKKCLYESQSFIEKLKKI